MSLPIKMRPLLIYIHGFQSSSRSEKAEETRRYIEEQQLAIDYIAPDLPNYPMAAFEQLQQLVEQHQPRDIGLIGSSLGGFMATALVQTYGLRAVLVNPAVNPDTLIKHFLGENQNPYTGVKFVIQEKHIDELRQLTVPVISHPEKIMVLLQAGDETLDYRQAVDYYRGSQQTVEEGGDHRFQDFQRHLPQALNFLQLQ